MTSTFAPKLKFSWLEPILNKLEALLWQDESSVDIESETYYEFKTFPASLKLKQRSDWAKVQTRILNPFVNGDVYYFVASKGVAIWCTSGRFSGLPETAAQQALTDGEHIVKGQHFCYQQEWIAGNMVACHTLTELPSDTRLSQLSDDKRFWARHRKIDLWLQQPLSWAMIATFWFGLVLCWQAGSFLSLTFQGHSLDTQIAELESGVAERLDEQAKLRDNQLFVSGVRGWQSETGYLPQVLAGVLKELDSTDDWVVNLLEWQVNGLKLELQMADLDITDLVTRLEQNALFERVAIRPHARKDTWVLEVDASE